MIASMFTIEVLAIQNCLLKEERIVIKGVIKKVQVPNTTDTESIKTEDEDGYYVIDNNETLFNDERDDNYYISKRYEISKLCNKAFSKPVYFLISFVIVGYLYVGVTTNGIIAGNALKDIISKTIADELPDFYYILIVLGFYGIAILISMNNINKLRKFSLFIIGCRAIIISIIFGVCIHTMYIYGISRFETIPKFEVTNITVMIGNSLFFFMSHHSVPGLVENFTPQRKLTKLLITGYAIALFILLTFGYVSLFTFSQFKVCDKDTFPGAIQVIITTYP
jgi:hypothetical protein